MAKQLVVVEDAERYGAGNYLGTSGGFSAETHFWEGQYIANRLNSPPLRPGKSLVFSHEYGGNCYLGEGDGSFLEMIWGWAFHVASSFSGASFQIFSTTGEWIRLDYDSSLGKLSFLRSDGVVIAASANGAMPPSSWCYLELLVQVDGADGVTVAAWRDNVQIIAPTSTSHASIPLNLQRVFVGNLSVQQGRWSDQYVLAGGAGDIVAADRFGPIVVEFPGPPTAAGTENDWVGSDGNSVDNHLLADEPIISIDTTTDYVEGSVSGEKQTFVVPDVSLGGRAIKAVGLVDYTRPGDGGAVPIQALVKDGVNEVLSTAHTPISRMKVHEFATAPDGGAWTEAKINSAEFGEQVV